MPVIILGGMSIAILVPLVSCFLTRSLWCRHAYLWWGNHCLSMDFLGVLTSVFYSCLWGLSLSFLKVFFVCDGYGGVLCGVCIVHSACGGCHYNEIIGFFATHSIFFSNQGTSVLIKKLSSAMFRHSHFYLHSFRMFLYSVFGLFHLFFSDFSAI